MAGLIGNSLIAAMSYGMRPSLPPPQTGGVNGTSVDSAGQGSVAPDQGERQERSPRALPKDKVDLSEDAKARMRSELPYQQEPSETGAESPYEVLALPDGTSQAGVNLPALREEGGVPAVLDDADAEGGALNRREAPFAGPMVRMPEYRVPGSSLNIVI